MIRSNKIITWKGKSSVLSTVTEESKYVSDEQYCKVSIMTICYRQICYLHSSENKKIIFLLFSYIQNWSWHPHVSGEVKKQKLAFWSFFEYFWFEKPFSNHFHKINQYLHIISNPYWNEKLKKIKSYLQPT